MKFVEHLYNFIGQKNDKGAALLKYVVSYTAYVSAAQYELSYAEQEDVQQEIAIKLLCQGHEIGERFTKRFLYVMIRNQCIDQQRKRRRQLATFVPVESSTKDDVHAPAPGPTDNSDVDLLESLECLEAIFDHIEQQPTGKSDIAIYTQYALGLSHKEIATQVKREPGAVTKRLSILRGHLRNLKDRYC